eukprot:2717267-Rhodomonas_salina.5
MPPTAITPRNKKTTTRREAEPGWHGEQARAQVTINSIRIINFVIINTITITITTIITTTIIPTITSIISASAAAAAEAAASGSSFASPSAPETQHWIPPARTRCCSCPTQGWHSERSRIQTDPPPALSTPALADRGSASCCPGSLAPAPFGCTS